MGAGLWVTGVHSPGHCESLEKLKNDKTIPPKLAQRILHRFLRGDLTEEVVGDLEEKFYSEAQRSRWRAKVNYWYQVFNYLRPFAIRKSKSKYSNHYPMFQSYFKIGWRNLLKNKSYVAINATGLGISLACCITVYLLLAFNIEFDNFHDDEKVASVFKFHTHSTTKEGEKVQDNMAPIMLGPIVADEITGIESYCRYLMGDGSLRYADNVFTQGIVFTDSTFFDFFEYPLIAGSHRSFKEKNTIFLGEELAKKYFGSEDPIGKLMVLNSYNETEIEVIVGGVLKKIPANNTMNFEAMMRIEHFIDIFNLNMSDWSDWRDPTTFVQLVSPENAGKISKQFDRYIPLRNKFRPDMVVEAYALEPFKAGSNPQEFRWSWVNEPIDQEGLVVFSSMALLILLIACFNLTNTSIAMTAGRLKEVGVRKSVGAARSQIISQFLFETFLIISLSLAVGLFLAQWIVPEFYSMWGLPYGLKDIEGLNFFIALVVMVFVASILAGIYPALISSKFKPTALLKGTVQLKGTNPLTRILVTTQFALSVIVLIGGVVFTLNTKYQEGIQFGYDKDKIITVNLQGEREFEIMKNAIASNAKILSIGVSDGNLGNNTYQTPAQIDTSEYNVLVLGVGTGFFETLGLRIAEGNFLNLDQPEPQKTNGVVVNKAFLSLTGMKDPLGKTFTLHGGRRIIQGVVENHVDNLYRSAKPEPFVFYPASRHQYISLLVKTEHENLPEIKNYLERTWKELFPNKPFHGRFQEDLLLANVRKQNANLKKIFLFITIMGGLLSAAGIFALASLNIAKRTKEIGIRKALGATVGNIVGLLNKEFVIVLSIAAVLGAVGGYYAIDYMLSFMFAYRIPVGLLPVIICATAIFAVGFLTTSATIMKAARSNPVDTLRSE